MSTLVAEPQVGRSAVDIGFVFKYGWRLFVKDIGPLVVGALIACGLSIVTLGVLAGPLAAGLYGMVVKRVRDGQTPAVGDVFGQMHRFWSFFGGAVVLAVVLGLAWVTIIGGVLLTAIWLYAFPLMVDRGLGFWAALGESKDLVVKAGFWEHVALVILFAVIASVANGALAVLAGPFLVAAVAAGYFAVTGRAAEVERV